MTENDITTKETGVTEKNNSAFFTQIYNVDLQKELTPNLIFSAGGSYNDVDRHNETNGSSSNTRDTAIRPYLELQLNSPLLDSVSSYRKSTVKEGNPGSESSKRYTKEYIQTLDWSPVDLPEVDFTFIRNQGYNDPTSTEEKVDIQSDLYQLESTYKYQNYKFNYIHKTSKTRNEISAFEDTLNSNHGYVRYSNRFYQGKVSLNSSVRFKRDKTDFKGEGDRRVPTTSLGGSFYNLDDPPPATSNVETDFVTNEPLTDINLLQNGGRTLSFGLDFSTDVDVDTIYVGLVAADSSNSQASPGEIASIENLYSWSVLVSDDQLTWFPLPSPQVIYDVFENRFEISFESARTPFVKITVTPQPTLALPGKEIRILRLDSFRSLPPDTSQFVSTEATADMNLNWKVNDKTTFGYDFIYREQRSEPFDDQRTILSNGVRLIHEFDDVFTGSTSMSHSQLTERGEAHRVGNLFSASLAARYLDTFNQVLTYSFSHRADEIGSSFNNSILLRNNLDLYEGWNLYLDGSYSWQNPADSANNDSIFVRVGSNVVPNRWMNFSLLYDKRWTNTDGQPQQQEQTGQLIASWVPLPSVSLSGDFRITQKTFEEGSETNKRQQYFISWSPFRDGTLHFSVSYSVDNDTNGVDSSSVSPSLRWKLNRVTLLTLDYSVGEREDSIEVADIQTARATLRIFY